MNIEIVYDSSTGTTARAAKAMGTMMEELGHQCQVQSVSLADPVAIAEADLICVGTWVKGLFIIRQHPTEETMRFIEGLEGLTGKKAVVFCTYKLAAGSTLRQMSQALAGKGADVVAQFKYRGPEPNDAFVSFAASLQKEIVSQKHGKDGGKNGCRNRGLQRIAEAPGQNADRLSGYQIGG